MNTRIWRDSYAPPKCPWCGGPMDESHPNCKAAGDEMAKENARIIAALQAIIDAR